MKNLIIVLLLLTMFLPVTHAQTFSLCGEYTPAKEVRYHGNTGTVTKVGVIVTGVGLVAGITGAAFILGNFKSGGWFVIYETNQTNGDMGVVLFLVGGVCEIAGGPLPSLAMHMIKTIG
jgi:hypothetical protein